MARHSTRLLLFVVVAVVFWSARPTLALAPSVVFTARRDFVAGTNPHAVAAGDFNRDGVPDLAVANAGDNTVSVLLGNGDGTFRPALTFGTGSRPWSVAVGDFDGNGVLDLAVANAGDNTVSVLLGNGDGTFRQAVPFGAGASPSAVVAGDFNRDGLPDLAVANYGDNTVSVLLGNGDGTFRPALPPTVSAGSSPASVVVGDFNRDGLPDLAVANSGDNTVSVLLGNGNGTFRPAIPYGAGSGPRALTVGDFNGDGRQDLVVANAGDVVVSVLLGNSDGTFQAAQTFRAGSGPSSVAVGDFNGDGVADLAVTSYGDNSLSVLLGSGTGAFWTFQPALTFSTGSNPQSVVVGDFNGDRISDLAVANYDTGMPPATQVWAESRPYIVSVLLGDGHGAFQAAPTYGVGTNPISVAVGDFNGDGKKDLAVANYFDNTVSVLAGDGHGAFQAAGTFAVSTNPYSVTVGDFNGDGKQDLVTANKGSNTISVLLGNGDGTFQAARNFSVGAQPFAVAVGDFNGDRIPDLAVANIDSNTVSVLIGNGDGTFQAPRTFLAGGGPAFVAVGDFNGDGVQDLAIADLYANTVAVLRGYGDGTFQAPRFFDAGSPGPCPATAQCGPLSIAVGDFNRDRKQDLAVVLYRSNTASVVSVLLGNGDGTFKPAQVFAAGRGPASVAVGDFNGDGVPDLAVANYGSNDFPVESVSVLLGNGDGTFQGAQHFGAGCAPISVAVGDFNGDGAPDLAVANFGSSPICPSTVSVLINTGSRALVLLSLTLSPTSVTGGSSSTGTVTLSGPAPAGGAQVTLSSTTPAVALVPGSVPVPAGATSATFAVSTSAVAATTAVTISASYGGVTQGAALTVTAPPLPTVSSLALSPTSVTGGNPSTGTVTLSGPAPAGGAQVTLSSSSPAVALVPGSVPVPAGATSATFTVTTSVVATGTSVTISASYGGGTLGAALTVTPAPLPTPASLTLNPTSVTGGLNSPIGTVTLNGPAPTGGAVVSLSSSDPAATVSGSVLVPAGTIQAPFTVTTRAVAISTAVSISASYGGGSLSASLTVIPPIPSSLTLSPTSVTGGTSSTGTVTLSGPAPAGDAQVTLSSSNTAVALVRGSVPVPAGATRATFTVTTSVVALSTAVAISASYGDGTLSASLTVRPLPLPILSSLSLSPASVTGGTSATGTVTLNGPAPSGGAVVSLSSSDPAATVPGSVPVPAGAIGATFTVSTTAVATSTSVTISASYGGGTRTASLTVAPLPPPILSWLSLSLASVTGGTSATGTVTLSGLAPSGGAVVSLSSSDPAATVPGSVPVPAGAISATFTVRTTLVAASTSVTISASYGGGTQTASLTVTPPSAGVSAPVLMWQYGGCLPGPYCDTGWYSSPAVADLDGDGRPEVIWGAYDVYVLNGADGSLKWRGPSNNRIWPGIAVADLTGAGTLELIVGRASDELTVYDRFGSVMWTRNAFGGTGGELRTLAVADLENRGRFEVIVGHAGGGEPPQLNVFEPDGTVRPGWPARHPNEPGGGFGMYNQNVAVADMNGDGFKEIFGPTTGQYITALDRNGNQLPVNGVYAPRSVWSQVGVYVDPAVDLRGYVNCGVDSLPNFEDSAPVIADVDGDGVPELIVVGNVFNCGTSPSTSLYHIPFIFKLDRTRWSGRGFDWTVLPTPSPGSAPRSEDYTVIERIAPNPVVADLDGDGFKEIIYPSYDGKVHAYWLDKTEHGSWPYTIPTTGASGDDFRFASEPIVVDLDNDGCAEVIFTSWPKKATGGVGQLHILNCLGVELYRGDLPGHDLSATWNGGLSAPTIANIDGSPDFSLVVGTTSSGVVAYKLPNSANARILWGTGRGNYRRDGTAAPR